MAIEKMKKLRLVAVSAQREEILRELMLLGCVEISEPTVESEVTLTRLDGAELSRVRSQHAVLTNGINLLDKYAPEKKKLLSPLPDAALSSVLDESNLPANIKLAEGLMEMDEQIKRASAQESRERAALEEMMPWLSVDLPLDFKGTEHTAAMFASFPSTQDMTEAEGTLGAACEEAQIFRVYDDKSLHYVLFVCLRDGMEDALAAIRPLGFTVVSFNETKGSAREITTVSEKKLVELAEQKIVLAAAIASESGRRKELKLCADTLATMIARADASTRLLCTESAFALEGWVPASELGRLDTDLAAFDCAWETEDPVEEDIPDVPVKLRNNKLTRALSAVTEMYSLPAYDGVDPNPLMAPFFILFYGIMMADMGYGLVMMLATGLVLLKKKPKPGGMRNFMELFFYCGMSTFAVGALSGGFFGDAPLQVAKILNPATTWTGLPSLFSPLDDTIMILLGSMALGLIHIVTGMAISFVEKIKNGEIMDAIFEEVTWWIVFAGIGCVALGAGSIVLIIGGVMVLAGPLITGVGFGKITGIFGTLYNHVTGFFGDILSYSRLMALMLAGSVIAQVFNTIGAIPGNLIFFLIVSIFGNTLNFALNLLGCYVHDLRLQCLEFFGKFYKDGGKAFEPLSIQTKYYNIDTVNN